MFKQGLFDKNNGKFCTSNIVHVLLTANLNYKGKGLDTCYSATYMSQDS